MPSHRVLGPQTLPRLDLDDGVPSEMRTLVVVPMLLTTVDDVDAQVAGLEVHYLGNPDGDVRFALLSDWLDADTSMSTAMTILLGRRRPASID